MPKPDKAGYWVVWDNHFESWEVVFVTSDKKSYIEFGYDQESDLKGSTRFKFIKPFDPEDIYLNKDF